MRISRFHRVVAAVVMTTVAVSTVVTLTRDGGPASSPTSAAAPVSYTHLRAHETVAGISYAVFCLKKQNRRPYCR
ncbi:hypothetical protein AERO_17580 [Aeromicrobium fastidiosum]|uniref:hypothetical protein n=1 Tax=Aeromicrobium fastidiosum TaxID=52699 RepID=UPI002023584E|nr:hypothetical protein [Aeromicrobium fastidiosum]MCL8253200.1 hypothetical protein [Aeromicrobium fastidiosum]